MHRTYIYQFVIKKPKRPQLTSDQATRNDQMVYEFYRQKLLTILHEVPVPTPPGDYEEAIPIDRDRPFNTLLVKETQRYNTLLEAIRKNLNNTLAVTEGLQQHDAASEDTFECLQYERTPREWVLHSYPAHDSMPAYVENLKQRIKYLRGLCDLAAQGEFKVRKFWIPGFFNQRNFLTTLQQECARRKGQPIERCRATYRIMGETEREYSARKAAGLGCYYIHGLYLYGASYSTERETLEDLHIKSPIGFPMPMIHVLVEHDGPGPASPRPGGPTAAPDLGALQDAALSPRRRTTGQPAPQAGSYPCPMFVNFRKNRVLNNQMAEGQVITYVPIPVKDRDPTFWVKRAIALLCYPE